MGARVAANLQHGGVAVQDTLLVPGAPAGITGTVRDLLLRVDRWREEDDVQQVALLYNRRADSNTARPTTVALLPVDPAHMRSLHKAPWPARGLPTHSMARADLLRRLLHQYLFVLLHRACAESQASEHASRLAAMQAAERNLDERLEEVTQSFRRARQNAITAELMDVQGGFEAIAGHNVQREID